MTSAKARFPVRSRSEMPGGLAFWRASPSKPWCWRALNTPGVQAHPVSHARTPGAGPQTWRVFRAPGCKSKGAFAFSVAFYTTEKSSWRRSQWGSIWWRVWAISRLAGCLLSLGWWLYLCVRWMSSCGCPGPGSGCHVFAGLSMPGRPQLCWGAVRGNGSAAAL